MNGAALALGRLYVGHCDPTFVPKDPTMPPGSTVLNGPVVIGGNIDGQLVKPLSTSALCNIIKPAEVTTTLVPVPTGMVPALTAGLKISALGDGAVPYPGPGILANAITHVISANVPVPPTAVGVNLLSSDMITMSSPAMTVTTNEVFVGNYVSTGTRNKVGAETQTGAKAETGAKADVGARAETGVAAQNATLNVAAEVKSPTITRLEISKKNFDIQHPTKVGWRLRHTCVESPTSDVYIRGKIKDTNIINLPDYWEVFVDADNITVSITPINTEQNIVVEKIENNKIYLKSSSPINCFYHVFAERADGEKLIPEYEGQSPKDYPGNNEEYSIAGYHYDVKN